MRARLVFLLAVLAVGTLGLLPAEAEPRAVAMRDCEFKLPFTPADVGDKVTWTYDEGSCSPANHRVKTYGSPPEPFDSSPSCTGDGAAFSADPSCMNEGPIKKERYTVTFDLAGTYSYYCPIHASLSGADCNGMCGTIKVNALPTNPPPTTPPATTPPATTPPAMSPPATSSPPGGTTTASPSPTGTTTVSPSPTSTELAKDDDGGGGPGRGFVALASLSVLGAAAFLVWRTFIAGR